MTVRAELAGPSVYVTKFVAEAQRILARYPEADRRSARLRLVAIVGAGWHLIGDDDVVLDEGDDAELAEASRLLARAAVSELDVKDRGRLLARMDDRGAELPGTEPSHFRVTLMLEGEAWTLRLSAHANGAAVTIASMAGTLVPERVAA